MNIFKFTLKTLDAKMLKIHVLDFRGNFVKPCKKNDKNTAFN